MRGDLADRAIPPRAVLRQAPGIADLLEPGEAPWTQLAVIRTPETLAAFRATVKPGLMVADRAFVAGLAPRFSPDVLEDRLPRPVDAPALVLAEGAEHLRRGFADPGGLP